MILRKENEQSTLERKVLKHREVEQHIHRPNYTASFANSINSESLPKVLLPDDTIEPIEAIKPLSLRDLPQEAPRDFKGRPLKPETRGHLEPGQPIHFN
jgi:hypothetical protein